MESHTAKTIVQDCVKNKNNYVGFEVFTACHLLARWFAETISSILKMEVETQRTTRRHIPEDDTLQKQLFLFNC
jgi:hypothetical protein